MNRPLRIGLIVPSSNVTIETELPILLSRHDVSKFTFHSSRMRMREVTAEGLAHMGAESARCVEELSDIPCHAVVYACLVALMAAGSKRHVAEEERLQRLGATGGSSAPVVSSAGALLNAIAAIGARRVALIAPYTKPLMRLVAAYIEDQGVEVVDAINLEVADNRAVGRMDPLQLVDLALRLDLTRAEAIVLSCCVQMPSLGAIETVERRLGLPVLSATTATVHELLLRLGLPSAIAGAGRLLANRGVLAANPGSASDDHPRNVSARLF
jgi:maleate isomerase